MSAEANAELIRSRIGVAPRVGLVLGSGLVALAENLSNSISIAFGELDGFPVPGVSGHGGTLVVGLLGGVSVAVLTGRSHYYEQGRADVMRGPLQTLKALGVETLILTNSAGGIRKDLGAGSVMMIKDHINFTGRNPLIGETDEARFVGMTQAYDLSLMQAAREAARAEGVDLREGVYCWFSGPSFETPAEVRAAGILGADAVGMSTVPEVILARFLRLRVLAFSVVTNLAAGIVSGAELSHQETKDMAPIGGAKLQKLLGRLIPSLEGRG